MKRLLLLVPLLLHGAGAQAQAIYSAEYGVSDTFDFLLYNSDGTLDTDEVDGGTEVSLSCDEGTEATATNDFVDEGTFYSITLTATEMQCARVAVVIAATDTNVFFIQTFGNASAMQDYFPANVAQIEGSDATDTIDARLTAYDAVVPADLPTNFADLSITATTGRVDVAAVGGTAQTANDNGADINAILADTADMQPKLGTIPDNGSGATIGDNLTDLAGATFASATDSLEAIRNRGDAAWITGGGGSLNLGQQETTIASVTSQTIFTPTATPTSDAQLPGWAVYFEDAGDADAYSVRKVVSVSAGAVTIDSAPDFTIATSDVVVFLPAFLADGVDVTSWNGTALSTTNPLPNAAAGANGGLPTVNASNYVAGLQGTLNTLDALDTAQDTQHTTTQGAIAALNDLDAAGVRTAVGLATANLDTQLAALPTAAENADAAWEELIADHSGTSGSTAEALNAAGAAGDPWTTALPGAYSAGQAGYIVGNNLDAAISTRSSQASLDTVDSNVDAVLVDTSTTLNNLVDDLETRLTAARAGYLDNLNGHTPQTGDSFARLGAPAGLSVSADIAGLNDLDAAGVRTAVGLATANLDTQLAALPTASENAAAAGALIVEDQGATYTLQCALATLLAYAGGEWSQSGSVATYQDPSGTENRLVGTIAASSRSSITITCP